MTTKLYLNFPKSNLRHAVFPDGETMVGRTSTCDVDVRRYLEGNLKIVSRQHFKITHNKGEGFILIDISHNGTLVNDINLSPGERRILRNGDVLKLAGDDDLMIKVTIEDDPEITETVPDPSQLVAAPEAVSSPPQSGLYFDAARAQFVVDNLPVPHEHLTKLEVTLLKYLCNNAGRLCSFDAIATQVWSDPGWAPGNNTISRAVGSLRKKLEQISPGAGEYIQNIRGQGYKVSQPPP